MHSEMITLAREARGLTQKELAHRLEISQGQLSRIEAGLHIPVQPWFPAKLAEALDYPAAFFDMPEPVYGPGVSEFFHRKRHDVPERVLAQTHAIMNIVRIHVERLLRSAETEDCRIPRYDLADHFGGSVQEAARAVRATLQVPKGPIKSVVDLIEDAGGIIVRLAMPTRKIDAVSWWVPGLPPLFFVNASSPPDRERMSLCHELAHMIFHREMSPEMETEANALAAELLMPADEIRPHINAVRDMHGLAGLKRHWRVSMSSLVKRAHDLGKIDDGTYRYLNIRLAPYRTREPPELDPPKETPTAFTDLLKVHQEELGYDIAQLSSLLCITPVELQAMYGVVPANSNVRSGLRILKPDNAS